MLLNVAKEKLPQRKKQKNDDWISVETLALIEERRVLKAKHSYNNRQQIRNLTREIRRMTRKDKETFVKSKCSEIEEHMKKGRSKDLFKVIKDIVKTKMPQCSTVKDTNGKILTESEDIKRRWRTYCEELYKKDPRVHSTPIPNENPVEEPAILLSEVENAIKKMKTGKSPGIDNIPAELIKAAGTSGAKVMLRICNAIWRKNEWPKEWGTSIFIPLPKKGDTRECKNNRTISLIPHASKIMLYIIAARIEQHLERELPAEQAGFRKGRGTRDQIANMRWLIEEFIEKNRSLFLTFIDYSKAFDCVDHNKMWTDLIDTGFPKHIVLIIQSLYSSQTAIVRTPVGDSDHIHLGKGVRQGCILSPYLFNMYGECIMRKALGASEDGVSFGGRMITNLRYADDTTLVGGSHEGSQRMLSKVNEASIEDGLYLNVDKTNLMHVNVIGNTGITAGGQDVTKVQQVNFLGSH